MFLIVETCGIGFFGFRNLVAEKKSEAVKRYGGRKKNVNMAQTDMWVGFLQL